MNHGYSGGRPTHYRAAEGPPSTPNPQQVLDDSGAQWLPYSDDLFFTLMGSGGSTRIYLQLRNNSGESNILSDAISYSPPLDQTGWEARIFNFSTKSNLRPGESASVSDAEIVNLSDSGNNYGSIPYTLKLINSSGVTEWTRPGTFTGGVNAGGGNVVEFKSQIQSFDAPSIEGTYTLELSIDPDRDMDRTNNSSRTTVFVYSDTQEKSSVFPFWDWDVRFVDFIQDTYNFNGDAFTLVRLSRSIVGFEGLDGERLEAGLGEFDNNGDELIYVLNLERRIEGNGSYYYADVSFGRYEYGVVKYIGGKNLSVNKGGTVTLVVEALKDSFNSSPVEVLDHDEAASWIAAASPPRRINDNRTLQIDFKIPTNESPGSRDIELFLNIDGDQVLEKITINVLPDPPLISSINPTSAIPGGEVILSGGNFSTSGTRKLLLDGNQIPTTSWSNTQVRFNVTEGMQSGNLQILANGMTSNSVYLEVSDAAIMELQNDSGTTTNPVHNFGNVEFGEASSERVFRIANKGNIKLHCFDFTTASEISYAIEGPDGTPLSSSSVSIASGEYVVLKLSYTPSDIGSDTHSLSFSTNDSNNPNVSIELTGLAVDTISPVVEITSPSSETTETLSSSIGLWGSFSDRSSVSLSYTVNGGSPISFQGSGGLWQIQGVPLAPGLNQITVMAEDSEGNTSSGRSAYSSVNSFKLAESA